jgi:hypothetical protein
MRKQKLKTIPHLGKLTLTFLMVVQFGCGQTNKTNSSNGINANGTIMGSNNLSIGANPVANAGGVNPSVAQSIQRFESQIPCQSGGQRIYKQFNSRQVYGNATTISAQFTDGAMPSTGESMVYVGVNMNSRDVIYLQKVAQGSSVIGFNATLSFCQIPYVVSSDRNLTNLTIRSANLDTDAYCGFGSVDMASTTVYSVKDPSQSQPYPFGCGGGNYYPQNPFTATYGICTNFAKVACNGRF